MGVAGDIRARDAVRDALVVGLAHFGVAIASLALTRWSNGLASVWLPNAILLAYLLQAPRARWPFATFAVMISGTVANGLGGAPLPLAPLFGITNGLEPLLVAWLLSGRRVLSVHRVRDLGRFGAAAALATMLSATIAAGSGTLAYAEPFGTYWLSWFVSSFLGLTIATPLLLIIGDRVRGRGFSRNEVREAVLILALVAAVAIFVFSRPEWPFVFALVPPMTFATFRLRAFGAATSGLLLVVIGTAAISLGYGPTVADFHSFSEQMIVLQAFIATSTLTALPLAAALGERDRIGLSLARREADLAIVLESVSDVIFRTDAQARWTYLNPAWELMIGTTAEESIGRSVLDHVVVEDRGTVVERMAGLASGLFDEVRHQCRFRTASGEPRWCEVQARRLTGSDGEMTGAAGIVVDISDRLALAAIADDARRRAERDAEAAKLLAATDELTGIASRRAFLAMLGQQLERGAPLAIALFDIDHFKRVNDRHGHAVGDEVLRRIAAIAESCVRDGDLVGRIGGEEFAIAMPGAALEQAALIGERLRQACAEAEHRPGVSATVSVGVAAASPGVDLSALLAQADEALYRAKAEGRNRLRRAA